jgi:hypothetical protein
MKGKYHLAELVLDRWTTLKGMLMDVQCDDEEWINLAQGLM